MACDLWLTFWLLFDLLSSFFILSLSLCLCLSLSLFLLSSSLLSSPLVSSPPLPSPLPLSLLFSSKDMGFLTLILPMPQLPQAAISLLPRANRRNCCSSHVLRGPRVPAHALATRDRPSLMVQQSHRIPHHISNTEPKKLPSYGKPALPVCLLVYLFQLLLKSLKH